MMMRLRLRGGCLADVDVDVGVGVVVEGSAASEGWKVFSLDETDERGEGSSIS